MIKLSERSIADYNKLENLFDSYTNDDMELIRAYSKSPNCINQINEDNIYRFTTIEGINEQIETFENHNGMVFYLTPHYDQTPKRLTLDRTALEIIV